MNPNASLTNSILYLLTLLRVGSRPIDRYIDYFGEHVRPGPAMRRPRRRLRPPA